MTDDEYISYRLESKERTKNMDPYREYILEKLQTHREITSAIIYDNLQEDFSNFEPSYRSVRRYVSLLRESEGLEKPMKIRQYMEVAELPIGFQAQVDLGVKVMKDSHGNSAKVYIFAMVLSCSRYKYVYFQTEPFTAKTFCEAHDRAFKYYGGRPIEIVYDQDRVMVVSENGGDIIFTEAFENYKNYAGFSVHLCRGSDPESKGKVEAVVKYVKRNFLACRIFHGIARLNSDGLSWLDRTGNGMVHETTKLVPKVAFLEEQKLLKSVPELGEAEIHSKTAIVRKNNVVFYEQNRYHMPKGTYRPGRKARIVVNTDSGSVCFYDNQSGEFLEELKLAADGVKGKCIRNTHPERDRRIQHNELIGKVIKGFDDSPEAESFVNNILANKPRYTRDQMCMIVRLQEKYTTEELLKAVEYCSVRELYSAADFGDTLGYFASKQDVPKVAGVAIPVKYSIVIAEHRPITAYASLSSVIGGGVS
jgi:transposase